jgi:cystathionine beta-lyase/cystathionine gamma-synthase
MKRADATRCVHDGEEQRHQNAPITTPIAQTSVFILKDLEEMRRIAEGRSDAYIYTRYANPTTSAAERKIAALEGGEACLITASGMAAELAAILALCRAGDELVSMLDVYGGTLKLFEEVLPKLGIRTRLVPYDDLPRLGRYLTRRTRMLFLESPTNPTLRCVDLAALSAVARKRGIPVVVDNTFATPMLQKPFALGADAILHSATKFLGGHSDLTAGALIGRRPFIAAARRMMILTGGAPDPFASYLLLRGMKTLELRVQRACDNAQAVADFLGHHPKVTRVFYPGLRAQAGHEAARRQMSRFGMMVAFDLRGGQRAAARFIANLELWYLAASLGGVESTVSYPLLSSHVGMPSKRLRQMGVTAATIRLSCGIEDSADLVADLRHALDKA